MPVACAEAVCARLCAVPVSDGVCTMVEAEAVRWYIVPVAIAEAVCEALCARCGYVYALA